MYHRKRFSFASVNDEREDQGDVEVRGLNNVKKELLIARGWIRFFKVILTWFSTIIAALSRSRKSAVQE